MQANLQIRKHVIRQIIGSQELYRACCRINFTYQSLPWQLIRLHHDGLQFFNKYGVSSCTQHWLSIRQKGMD